MSLEARSFSRKKFCLGFTILNRNIDLRTMGIIVLQPVKNKTDQRICCPWLLTHVLRQLVNIKQKPKKSLTENHCSWNVKLQKEKPYKACWLPFGDNWIFSETSQKLVCVCAILGRSPCMPNLTILFFPMKVTFIRSNIYWITIFYCSAKTSEKNNSAKKRDLGGYRRNVKFLKKVFL